MPLPAICTYVHSYLHVSKPSSLRQERGPERSPLLSSTLRGFLLFDLVEGSLMYITVHSTCGTIGAPLSDQLGDPNGPLFFCGTPGAPLFDQQGDPNGPLFYSALRGILTHRHGLKNKSASPFIFGPRVHSIVYIFQKIHLWLVIVILKSLNLVVSCIPVLYYVYCICFMLFRSTCSWPFSEENPLRVASEALNIHLVSCIL